MYSSQSALKQAFSNRKTMTNHIAQKTTEDVFLSFVIYQGDIIKVLSYSMLVFKNSTILLQGSRHKKYQPIFMHLLYKSFQDFDTT